MSGSISIKNPLSPSVHNNSSCQSKLLLLMPRFTKNFEISFAPSATSNKTTSRSNLYIYFGFNVIQLFGVEI